MRLSRVLLPILIVGVVAGYWTWHRHSHAAPQLSKAQLREAQVDLRQLMQAHVHEEYSRMSFFIWHDQPLTPDKMNEIAESSARMVNLAQNLSEYENTYIQQGWGKQDVKFFDENRTRLLQTAEQLKGAAKEGDESRVVHLFNHMDSTCQSCHKRFRPDLSWS